MTIEKKKLIEVALPLDAINKEAAREKSIRHGHPSTLHLWWARRPLAACRAVLFAQLVDDPSSHPEKFPTDEAQEIERERLFGIIERLVKWENINKVEVLKEARAEIVASCDGHPPPILDPFAGGGSIPLEAQRLGLEVHASDLNPVAVLINKALISIPPRWVGKPPVHPREGNLGTRTWTRAQGLAADVRHYGRRLRDEAQRSVGHLYPQATLNDGSKANVIAWIWTRAVTCPNPACGAQMPLASSFWLGKRKGKERWVKPVATTKAVRFEIGSGSGGPPAVPKTGRGANFRCLVCGEQAPEAHIKAEGIAGRMSAQLMAVVAEGQRTRIYLPPSTEHEDAAILERPVDVPETLMPNDTRAIWCTLYGLRTHADLFTNRQLTALAALADGVSAIIDIVSSDAIAAGLAESDAAAYSAAVATYLAFALSKLADRHSTLTNWYVSRESTSSTFQRQALPMLWDYAETNPWLDGTGTYLNAINWTAEVVDNLGEGIPGQVVQADATTLVPTAHMALSTDPPYYDNIGYADLADYFYVWLRRSLRTVYPELFGTMLTPKSEELIANPYRFAGSKADARSFFEEGFVRTFRAARDHQPPHVPMTIFYAYKQSESEGTDGRASTGWETMLEGLMQAGLAVTATWPMRTEASNRMIASGTNALASSIVLACRPRALTAGVTDRRGFMAALKDELPAELRVLQQGSIAPVDLAQAAIGPGMAVFSRYAKVLEHSGDPMQVRVALSVINQVLDDLLGEQEGDFDSETRWAIKWFEQFGMDDASSGVGDDLSRAYGVALNGLERSGIIATARGKTRLLDRSEMPVDWDPARGARVSIWEATQHLVLRLETHGERGAAALKNQLGGLADSAQLLAYRLFAICEKKNWAKEAAPCNALAASGLEIRRIAETMDPDAPVAPTQAALEGLDN